MSDHIDHFIALGPAVKLDNTKVEFFKTFSDEVDTIQWWLEFFGIDELFGVNWQVVSSPLCAVVKIVCEFNSFVNDRGVR